MTLILTAICGDGVAMCADKRRTFKTKQSTQYFDDLEKIFRFSDSRTLAYNHAINRIVGMEWRTILTEFEGTFNVGNLTCLELADKFTDFASDRVKEELAHNTFDDSVGFVFGAVRRGRKPEVRELFWKRGQPVEIHSHRGLVRSGDGKKYLNNHISDNSEMNTVEYWQSLPTSDALAELRNLFAIASGECQRLGGQELSISFETDAIWLQETA